MHHHTAKMLQTSPKYQGRAAFISGAEGLKMDVIQDGTHTISQLTYGGMPVATGHAKRKLTDRRDDELGSAIAISRMFAEAAEVYAEKVEYLLSAPPEEEYSEAETAMLRTLRQQYQKQAKQEKNDRRRAARVAYFEKLKANAKDGDAINDQSADEWLILTFDDWGSVQ